ncbi:hypothetical protein BN1058_00999 [Paraliobacillus sp. PM-2]|uniref:DUF4430 domain-containing protein n=1 Tax=Paraliobacillus sp. PM-2 TaxID=1462524 RepID=UPI00061C565E|nr:DUF4430 domain-containing protein [Paraliobacillus sp. PM-2]CQR46726.1 hypothetical protein BN1058_00999 [Paraliobacillus sp. PM-2]
MKKFNWIFLLLTLSMFIVGCQANDQTSNTNGTVTITISENKQEEIIATKEIELNDETNLMTLMEENFDIVVEGDGFITAIEGEEQVPDNNLYWMYTVNGEQANVGASDFELSPNDKVNFDLQEVSY